MPRIHPLIGPLLLLSVVTSTALNRATLARKEDELRSLHQSQVAFLSEQLNLLRHRHTTSKQDIDLTVKRSLALGIHPHDIGIYNVPTEIKRVTPERLSWNQVFFGSESVLDKLKTSVGNAAVGLKGQFSSSSSPTEKNVEEVKGESDQWEDEFIKSIRKIEQDEVEQRRLQEQLIQQQREEREREAKLAYLKKYEQAQQQQQQMQTQEQQQQPQSTFTPRRKTLI